MEKLLSETLKKKAVSEVNKKVIAILAMSLITVSSNSAWATHTGKVNPWKKRWSTVTMERMAKTVWCIEHGFRDYNKRTDRCKK